MPTEFIADILGHEGEGSLLSLLRKKGLANELHADCSNDGTDRNTACWLFNVEFVLTKHGSRQPFDVLDYLFQFLSMLRKNGIPRELYEELKQLSEINFRFRSKAEPLEYVETLADSLNWLPPKDILVGNEVYLEYNEELISSTLEKLIASNCRIDILSKSFEDSCNLKES